MNGVDFANIFSSITNRTPCTENRARNKRKSGIQPRTAALMQQLANGIWAKLIHYHKGSVFIFTLKRLLSNIGSKIRWGLCLIYCGNVHYGDKYFLWFIKKKPKQKSYFLFPGAVPSAQLHIALWAFCALFT